MTPTWLAMHQGKISRCMRRSNMFQPYCTTSTRRSFMNAVS